METKEKLVTLFREVLRELELPDERLVISHPDLSRGDYSTNIAMLLAKKGEEAETLAQKIKTILESKQSGDLVDRFDVLRPGFINIFLTKKELVRQLDEVLKTDQDYAKNESLAGKKWMVEFAHPNTLKEFHIGHLRNITLGESLCRLFTLSGVGVIRANYQGDVGLHIAKALWGVQQLGIKDFPTVQEKAAFLAKAYVLGNKEYNDSLGHKSDIEEINKKLYAGDKKLSQLWEKTRAWSLEYFDVIYKRLGTRFDRLYFESETAQIGKDSIERYLDTVFKEDEGAIIFPGEQYGLHNRVFITSRGIPTYEAKDIGLAQLQFSEHNPARIIHVVGPEQTEYFKVVFAALERVLPKSKGKEYHVRYGWVRLKTGKMSSRTGDVVSAVWLLDEVKARLKKAYKMEEDVAEKVAVGAVKHSMLRMSPESEIVFDINQSIRLDGDSGPYLQYTYARCRSVLRKSTTDYGNKLTANSLQTKADSTVDDKLNAVSQTVDGLSTVELKSEELALLRTFYKFPEVVEDAAHNYAPNLLCNFLYDLASKYNLMYNNLPILEQRTKDKEQSNLRLALTFATAQILKTGLGLLGIETPERM
ncbi:arginine--tRNA ligase [Candidatus Microgenomates bacterium]|nr:arginine--tRNA ligase [Candidatus Microgenomates bacterium]